MSVDSIWFPFYVGDYVADTMHLSTLQHGAYDLLLFSYYKNQGPLPDDDERMARITKLSVSDWGAIRSAMVGFFQIKDGKWFHKRAEFEIKRRKSAQLARQQAAKATNKLRWGSSVTDTVTESVSDRKSVAIHNHNHNQIIGAVQPTLAEVLVEAELRGILKATAENFWNHFESSGWIDKNGHPVKKWQPKLVTWAVSDRAQPTERAHHTGVNGRPRPLSLFDIKTILQAKQTEADAIKNQHYSLAACGGKWDNELDRSAYSELKKQIRQLNHQISQMA